MITAAYKYAKFGGEEPKELKLLGLVDRFGVEPVFGRKQLTAMELRTMLVAENVYQAYKSMKSSKDASKWAADNPGAQKIIAEAERLLNG